MEKENQSLLLNKLLQYELYMFAKSLGLSDHRPDEIEASEIASLLNYANELSRNPQEINDKKICLLICGIIWERYRNDWPAISSYICQILIRLGLSPTSKMINWDKEFNQYGSFGSLLAEVAAAENISRHEIKVRNNTISLSGFQKNVWEAIDHYKFIGISAETSSGKSYVLSHKIAELLENDRGQIVFIVPTISLINQVSLDIRNILDDYGMSDVGVFRSVSEKLSQGFEKCIFVLTQERAAGALSSSSEVFDNVLLLVVDEVQNIERTTNDGNDRSMTLLEVIHDFRFSVKPNKIVISGPRLDNLESIVGEWSGKEGICVDDRLPAVLNITYSFKKVKRKNEIEFIQYSSGLSTESIRINDEHKLKDKILGKKKYSNEIHDFLSSITQNLAKESSTLIFSKSSPQAVSTARELSKRNNQITSNDKVNELIEYSKETVHPKYSLVKVLEKEFGYHHGKMPHHMRVCMEHAFKEKYIKTLVCTTTLMQGVNLPAKNIIIRNPSVAKESLTSYEYANLRGRAGRLMKDFVGRAIVIDDASFEDENIDLKEDSGKTLDYTYGNKFENNKDEIIDILKTSDTTDTNNRATRQMVTYVRQMFVRYGEKALERLREVGINLNSEEINKIKSQLDNIKFDIELCKANPFFDPIDLQEIKKLVNKFPTIPNSPFDLSNGLYSLLVFTKDKFNFYFKKYLNIEHDGKLKSICSMTESWAKGSPLRTVIEPSTWPIDQEDDVENRLKDITNHVIYDIPTLIKPFVMVKDSESQILSYVESGAFAPELRTLIGLGLSREASLRILELDSMTFLNEENLNWSLFKKTIAKLKAHSSLSYWDKIQLDNLSIQ